MAENYSIKIDYRNCKNEEDKLAEFDKKIKKFNRKIFKKDILQQYIDSMYYVKPSQKKRDKKTQYRFKRNK